MKKIRGGVFRNEELALPGDHPDELIGSIGGESILGGEAACSDLLPAPEERREEIVCDHRDCLRQRLVINGSAVDQPKGWSTDTWFHVNGKDYCPDHGPSYGAVEGAAEVPSADGAPSPYPVSDYLLDEAERIAGISSVSEHDELSEPVTQSVQGFPGATQKPPLRRHDPKGSSLGWFIAVLSGVIFALGWLIFYLWIDLDVAQFSIAEHNKSTFEESGNIVPLDCDRRGNTFNCSGEVRGANQGPRPVRYFCDKDNCHFECGQ